MSLPSPLCFFIFSQLMARVLQKGLCDYSIEVFKRRLDGT
jgi:hypothetical protein